MILIFSILVLSLSPSHSRPQGQFFSTPFRRLALLNPNPYHYQLLSQPLGFSNNYQTISYSDQGFLNGRNGASSQTRKLSSVPNLTAWPGLSLRVPASTSGDIIEQTRIQADSLKNILSYLARKPEAAPILEKVFERRNETTCINNMDEAIEAIETSTQLVEKAGREIKLLVEKVQEFPKISGMSEAVRQAAKIIRLLDVLIPKISPPSSTCKPANADVLYSMRDLESLLIDLSSKADLYYNPQVRQSLHNSAKIISKATAFLDKESHFKFENFCTKNNKYNKEFLTAVSNMMSDLADLYADLGGDIAAEEIRKQEDFTKKMMVRIAQYM